MTEVFTPKPSIKFYDDASKREMLYVYPHNKQFGGWLYYKHPHTSEWVSLRKATDKDLTALNQAVIKAHHA